MVGVGVQQSAVVGVFVGGGLACGYCRGSDRLVILFVCVPCR